MSKRIDYAKMERPQLERRLAQYVDHVPCGCYRINVEAACNSQDQCARGDLRRLVRRLRGITQRERARAEHSGRKAGR